MKLLLFIYSLSSGGAERVTATLANHWAAKGWAVTVVTVASTDRDFYALAPQVRRVELNLAVHSRHLGQAVVNNLRRVFALHRILRQEKPSVAVAMMATANVMLAIAGHLSGVPTIGSERTNPVMLPLGRFWELARRWTYPLLGCLVAQTRESAAWLQEHAPVSHIAVIPNPVLYPMIPQPPHFLPATVIAPLRGRRLLLAVGRLEEEKGLDRLLIAFSAISERHADWSLVILGQGSLRQALMEQAAELSIQDRFAMPGTVGNIGEWFEVADLYVLTSRFEGFPNTLLEALAHGLPSVAVDCETGPREIVRHEVDGLLVPQDQPEALMAALDRMMSDPALRARFSERAIEARERFSVERVAGQWEELFKFVQKRYGTL